MLGRRNSEKVPIKKDLTISLAGFQDSSTKIDIQMIIFFLFLFLKFNLDNSECRIYIDRLGYREGSLGTMGASLGECLGATLLSLANCLICFLSNINCYKLN